VELQSAQHPSRFASREGLVTQCLDRHIESRKQLAAETALWEQQRNAVGARINWLITTKKARSKMARAYPKPLAASAQRQRFKTSVTRY
jgi:hypothetical protein